MLNRRKQLQDLDYQNDDERALLIGDVPHNPDNSVQFNQYPQTRFIAPYQNVIGQSSTQLSNASLLSLSLSNQRKARDRSPEVNHSHIVSRYPTTNNLVARRYESSDRPPLAQQAYSGESYELASSGAISSRAIDFGGTDSYKYQTDFIYYNVQPGDTLQNLSVKYSCPVASIKRLNNLWSDQEFYGLSKLKLPAGKLRLIADVINEERANSSIPETQATPYPHTISPLGPLNQFPTTSTTEFIPSNLNDYVHNDDCDSYNPRIDREDFIGSSSSDSIFKNLDLNIAKARTAARSYDDNASAILQSLADSGNIVVEEEDPSTIACREAETLLNDMSDYGLSYSGLILFIFIVCLICPLAYVIYLEETHYDSNKAP